MTRLHQKRTIQQECTYIVNEVGINALNVPFPKFSKCICVYEPLGNLYIEVALVTAAPSDEAVIVSVLKSSSIYIH